MNRESKISAAKDATNTGEVIGHREEGRVFLRAGKLYALKHNIHRYNGGEGVNPWGRENGGYKESDLMEIGYRLSPFPTPRESLDLNGRAVTELKDGAMPEFATVGLEIEGPVYDRTGESLISVYGDCGVDVLKYPHPELLSFSLETATGKSGDHYPRTPVEIATSLAQTVLEGQRLASLKGGRVVYTSVPEGGHHSQAEITPHPYLLSFAPKVLGYTLERQADIPAEVLETYAGAGVDIVQSLAETGTLNWPTHALHVHTGVPLIEGQADPRTALAMGQLRRTELAKVMSFALYNTRHLYGYDTGGRDVRSVIRRLLASAHSSQIPDRAIIFVKEAFRSLKDGSIHSLPRYPRGGQHDVLRLRMDGDKRTVESIDAPMNPDLRLVLFWTYFNQVMNVMAVEAMAATGGDEAAVLPYLQTKWGSLFRPISALGQDSSYEHDLEFNRAGFAGVLSRYGAGNIGQVLNLAGAVVDHYGTMYPAVKTQADIIGQCLDRVTSRGEDNDLVAYFGTEKGYFEPNGLNLGLVTDHKKGLDPKELVLSQNLATLCQAEALAHVRDEQDLRAFFA